MERNKMIDLLKFVFSIGMIAIHTQLFKTSCPFLYQSLTMGILRIGVPFFFVVSGYYFYHKVQTNDYKTYIFKIIKLFVLYELIEIVLYIPAMPYLISELGLVGYILKIFTTGLGGAYWYLTSLIVSLLIIIPFIKKDCLSVIAIIGGLLYLFTMSNDSYSVLFLNSTIQKIAQVHESIFVWPQAGLCSSLLYLSIGAMINRYKIKIHSQFILVGSLLLLLVEVMLLQTMNPHDGNCYLSLIIATPALFIYALSSNIKLSTTILGEMSLYIYMIHPLVNNIIGFILPIYDVLKFMVVVIITFVIAYMLVKRKSSLKKRKV